MATTPVSDPAWTSAGTVPVGAAAASRRRGIACLSSAPANPYLRLLYTHLRAAGIEQVEGVRFTVPGLVRARRDVAYLHFHWIDGLTRWERGAGWARPALAWARVPVLAARLGAARVLGYRVAWTIHQVYPHERASRRRERAVALLLARASHVLLAHDAATAERARAELGRAARAVAVVPHGSYAGTYPAGRGRAEVRAELGIPPEAFVFLAFGELRAYKGIGPLLDAFCAARSPSPLRLVVAGHPKDTGVRAAVEEAAARDSRIVPLLAHVPDERVRELFEASDAAVVARGDGGTSGALVLACSLGVPAVAADLPAYRELTDDGRAGWLFDPGDPSSLRTALEAAAADPAASGRGRAARVTVTGHHWPDIAERTARLLAGERAEGPFSIVCVAGQEWAIDLPTNRQQIMLRAARRGHRVLYVESGPFLGRHVAQLVRGGDRRSTARRLLSAEEVAPGILVRHAVNALPWSTRFGAANAVDSFLTSRALRRLVRRLPRPVVLWLYDPTAARLIGSCGEDLAVYDCVDDYAAIWAGVYRDDRKRSLITATDADAARRSRLVFTTAPPLYERQRRLNPETHFVPNVGDYEHFVAAADPAFAAAEVSGLPRPVIGFAGNLLTLKIDFALLDEVARARPAWTLLLVGPARSDAEAPLAALRAHPNVHWVGPKTYAELPSYVAAFDVGVIPYLANGYTQSCFPLKLYEYLAAGKPVVASRMPALAGLEPDVALADDAAAFVDAVERALGLCSEADRARRMAVAARNTWDGRAGTLLGLVSAAIEG